MNYMRSQLASSISLLAVAALVAAPTAFAQTQAQPAQVPTINLNDSSFHLITCDGPDLSGLKTGTIVRLNQQDVAIVNGQNPMFTDTTGKARTYVPCDFQGAMVQAQYILNLMTIAAVLAALIGFSFAGYLYITGVEKNISRAKSMFPKIVIGFIIILVAWFAVYQVLAWLTGNIGAYHYLGQG